MPVPFIYNNVHDTTTTAGNGTLTLDNSAPVGRQTIGSATGGTNKLIRYSIIHRTSNEFENGIGTYTHSSLTLSRDTVLSGSNGGSAVTFSAGTKDVYIAPLAEFPRPALVDLDSAKTIIDDDVADTLIADTSKPASPQYTKTITSGDIPTHENVENYMVLFSIAGKNNDISTRTINWRFTLNGTDIGTADNNVSPTVAAPFWRATGRYMANALVAGDVLGIKLWGSVASQLDYRAITIYIIPRIIVPAFGQVLCLHDDTNSTMRVTDAGAISGASYTAANLNVEGGYYDGNANKYKTLGTGTIFIPFASSQQKYLTFQNGTSAPTDNNSVANGINAAMFLSSVVRLRYITGVQF